jgi:uncharacterized protein
MNKTNLIEDNKNRYKDTYHLMKWVTEEQAANASKERDVLLKDLFSAGVKPGYDDTKIDCRNLSPGCRCCGEGTWSCLFINGICNGACFYCPAVQNDKSLPTTNTVEFPNAQDYIDYVELFGFKGIGLSGGEPLLTLDRTLEYLSEIKNNFAGQIHVWLYTNGIQLTEKILRQLKDAGLDEIRFDLGAVSYNLEKVKPASQYINTVTVEIPAVPEDFPLLCKLLPEMKEAGVQYLNLHQLRCTPHNCNELIKRGYTFLHGPKVTVLESELTALRLLKYSIENKIDLPINYCSFIYKNRYQGIAAQKRHASLIKKPFEDLTCLGLIRSISVKGDSNSIDNLNVSLKSSGSDPILWNLDKQENKISLHPSLSRFIDEEKFSLCVSYHFSHMKPSVSYMNPFKEVRLKSGKKLVIERQPVCPVIELHEKSSIHAFKKLFLNHPEADITGEEETTLKKQIPDIDTIWDCERITPGLLEYF